MKMSSFLQVSELEVAGTYYDLVLFASGFEARASHLCKVLGKNLDSLNKTAVCFNDRIVLSRQDNDKCFSENGFTFIATDGSSKETIENILVELVGASNKTLRILIDYTSMTKCFYAAALNFFRNYEYQQPVEITFCYSPAQYSHPGPYEPNTIVEPMEGFSSLDSPDLPTSLVLGLGYENERALGLVDFLDPAHTYLFVTNPALDSKFVQTVANNNKSLFSITPPDRVFTHPILDLITTANVLKSVCEDLRSHSRVVIAPLGIKPFALVSFLVSIAVEGVDVWRVTSGVSGLPQQRHAAGPIVAARISFHPDQQSSIY